MRIVNGDYAWTGGMDRLRRVTHMPRPWLAYDNDGDEHPFATFAEAIQFVDTAADRDAPQSD